MTTLATLTLNLNDKKEPAKGTQQSEPRTSWCKGPGVEEFGWRPVELRPRSQEGEGQEMGLKKETEARTREGGT